VEFKTTGKQILQPGWRVVIKPAKNDDEKKDSDKERDEERVLPSFVKGEHGPHEPSLAEKWTTPPKPYTEATLLRAMETAGKGVEDETLREALKENGIGRPSTRAAIIETLFKRRYIVKERKSLAPTQTGIELIGLIHEELLKSAELTGIWEKKLREIEQHKYNASQFIAELKQMVVDLVREVMNDNSNRRVAVTQVAPKAKGGTRKRSAAKSDKQEVPKTRTKKSSSKTAVKETAVAAPAVSQNPDDIVGTPCPLCHKGHIIKGHTAYGCSEWRNGCTFRKPF